MRRGTLRNSALCIAVAVGLTACGSSGDGDQLQNGGGTNPNQPGVGPGPGGTTQGGGGGTTDEDQKLLDSRKVDYGEALRTASLKLTGDLPTFDQIQKIATAADEKAQKTAYEAEIDKMLADPRFAKMVFKFWQDTLATGGTRGAGFPSYDFSAAYAASVIVNDKPYSEMFTATTGTCPTFNAATGVFTAGNCPGTGPTAGLVGNPDLQSNYFSNMAFRRARMLQEKFACSKFPAEFSTSAKPMGAGTYTSPWDFDSISGGAGAKIDFKSTDSIVCANCHTTMNHFAPLLAYYDDKGAYTMGTIQVQTPVSGNPKSIPTDWLPAGQSFAWRNGKPVTDIPSLGAAMAADPDVQRCINTRLYNWAMSKGDVVNDIAAVPAVITDPFLKVFTDNGQKIKPVIKAIFTADDFVKF
jgi:hypothetical protein